MVGVVAGGIVIVGGIWTLIHTLGQREPLYENKRLYDWVVQVQSKDSALANEAKLVLDRTIIPQLTRKMFTDTNDSRLRLALIERLNGLPNVNIEYKTADTCRIDAVNALAEFGQAAVGAVPALLKALQGQDIPVRAAAAGALGKLQAQPAVVIPLLIKSLDDENINESAALALAEYGPPAKDALPKLLELYKVREKGFHRAVTKALSSIDPASAARVATP